MITIFGIRNCDTVKKALKWSEEQGFSHQFHDFRKSPLSVGTVADWLAAVGPDILINRRGTTYRKLDDDNKRILEGNGAAALLAEQPTLMKRPIFETDGNYVVGFKEAEKEAVLALVK